MELYLMSEWLNSWIELFFFEFVFRVLYFSIHAYMQGTFWPNLRESDYHNTGRDAGLGYNVNIPINQIKMQNGDYMAIFQQLLLPMAHEVIQIFSDLFGPSWHLFKLILLRFLGFFGIVLDPARSIAYCLGSFPNPIRFVINRTFSSVGNWILVSTRADHRFCRLWRSARMSRSMKWHSSLNHSKQLFQKPFPISITSCNQRNVKSNEKSGSIQFINKISKMNSACILASSITAWFTAGLLSVTVDNFRCYLGLSPMTVCRGRWKSLRRAIPISHRRWWRWPVAEWLLSWRSTRIHLLHRNDWQDRRSFRQHLAGIKNWFQYYYSLAIHGQLLNLYGCNKSFWWAWDSYGILTPDSDDR